MNFPKDFLAELETPTRIFRSNINKYASPTKPRTRDTFLCDLFLNKRETLDIDDFSNFNPSIKNEFIIDEKVKLEVKTSTNQLIEAETRAVSEQVGGPSPQTVKENPIPIPNKFESSKKLTETVIQPDNSNNLRTDENDLQSENEFCKASIRKLSCPEIECTMESTKATIQKYTNGTSNNKYQDNLQQRISSGNPDKSVKRKKIGVQSLERNQIKSRANRVSQFWKGSNSFIPSVFRVIKLEREPEKVIIEFQDFSLKGLCHMDENPDYDDCNSKLSTHLDRLGDDNLNEIYGIMGTRTLL